MDIKVILGGIIGGLLIIVFALAILLIVNSVLDVGESSVGTIILIFVPLILAPFGGGFLAGKFGKLNPRQSGIIAGLLAGLFIMMAWFFINNLNMETLISGVLILVMWVILAVLASGLSLGK